MGTKNSIRGEKKQISESGKDQKLPFSTNSLGKKNCKEWTMLSKDLEKQQDLEASWTNLKNKEHREGLRGPLAG